MTTAHKSYTNDDFGVLIGKGIYHDTGCDLAPSCLRCPFETCRYDLPGGRAQLKRVERDQLIRAADKGVHPQALAKQWRISLRNVYRILSGR